jgi:hypothetical protein
MQLKVCGCCGMRSLSGSASKRSLLQRLSGGLQDRSVRGRRKGAADGDASVRGGGGWLSRGANESSVHGGTKAAEAGAAAKSAREGIPPSPFEGTPTTRHASAPPALLLSCARAFPWVRMSGV